MKDQPTLETKFINGGVPERHPIKPKPKAKASKPKPQPAPPTPAIPAGLADLAPPEPRKNLVMNMPLGLITRLKSAAHTYSLKTGRRVTQQMIVETAIAAWLASNQS
jgi:hypothetical protein